VNSTEDVNQALAVAIDITPQNGLICACGSLFLIGEILKAVVTAKSAVQYGERKRPEL
jgi:citrate lyase synthetase